MRKRFNINIKFRWKDKRENEMNDVRSHWKRTIEIEWMINWKWIKIIRTKTPIEFTITYFSSFSKLCVLRKSTSLSDEFLSFSATSEIEITNQFPFESMKMKTKIVVNQWKNLRFFGGLSGCDVRLMRFVVIRRHGASSSINFDSLVIGSASFVIFLIFSVKMLSVAQSARLASIRQLKFKTSWQTQVKHKVKYARVSVRFFPHFV